MYCYISTGLDMSKIRKKKRNVNRTRRNSTEQNRVKYIFYSRYYPLSKK